MKCISGFPEKAYTLVMTIISSSCADFERRRIARDGVASTVRPRFALPKRAASRSATDAMCYLIMSLPQSLRADSTRAVVAPFSSAGRRAGDEGLCTRGAIGRLAPAAPHRDPLPRRRGERALSRG